MQVAAYGEFHEAACHLRGSDHHANRERSDGGDSKQFQHIKQMNGNGGNHQ
ncbi:hypothetical protein D3C85_1891850 [compost metagenome]